MNGGSSRQLEAWKSHGLALCAEAQADGVPCVELGRDCEMCARAVRCLSPADLALLKARLASRRLRGPR